MSAPLFACSHPIPPAHIGLAPDAFRLRSTPCRPCGRRFAASGRRSPRRLRSTASHGSPSLRRRSRCAHGRRGPANGSPWVAVRALRGSRATLRGGLANALVTSRFPGPRSRALTIPTILGWGVCQDRLCAYKVTWVPPPMGGGACRVGRETGRPGSSWISFRGPDPERYPGA